MLTWALSLFGRGLGFVVIIGLLLVCRRECLEKFWVGLGLVVGFVLDKDWDAWFEDHRDRNRMGPLDRERRGSRSCFSVRCLACLRIALAAFLGGSRLN